MYINSISPVTIRNFIAPVLAAPVKRVASAKKKRKSSKVKTLDESIEDLFSEISTEGSSQLSKIAPELRNDEKYEDVKAPEYDPEDDMSEARFDESKQEPVKDEFNYYSSDIQMLDASSAVRLNMDNSYPLNSTYINNDRFTYFTLIETILISNILFNKFPEGELKFSFGVTKILDNKKSLETQLLISKNEKEIKKYRLVYEIIKSFFSVYDFNTNTKVGELDFILVGKENYVEEVHGRLEGNEIHLDPVWHKNQPDKIKYQTLKIGHRKLDLTATSKKAREGHWSFKGNEQPVPFSVIYNSYETKIDHILTQKSIRTGKSSLEINLKYIDDVFPEPYSGTGVAKIEHNKSISNHGYNINRP
ncbi:MAG: hypothetical protein GY730_01320 [bacterium]|nr:hypothetical protein [bacterium]